MEVLAVLWFFGILTVLCLQGPLRAIRTTMVVSNISAYQQGQRTSVSRSISYLHGHVCGWEHKALSHSS